HRVAHAYPRCRDTEIPAELTGVADEYHGGEIRSAVCERREPRSYRTAAEYEALHRTRARTRPDSYEDHDSEIYEEHDQITDPHHKGFLLRSFYVIIPKRQRKRNRLKCVLSLYHKKP